VSMRCHRGHGIQRSCQPADHRHGFSWRVGRKVGASITARIARPNDTPPVDQNRSCSEGGPHRKSAMPTANTLWRNASFRSYADYAETEPFRVGLDELRALNRDECCVIVCAEAVW
jgi:hypothetical protein